MPPTPPSSRRRVRIQLDRLYRFLELPPLIASALFEEGDARAKARIAIERDLKGRVDDGSLVLRDPEHRGRLTLDDLATPIDLGNGMIFRTLPSSLTATARFRFAVIFGRDLVPLLEDRGLEVMSVEVHVSSAQPSKRGLVSASAADANLVLRTLRELAINPLTLTLSRGKRSVWKDQVRKALGVGCCRFQGHLVKV